MAVKIYRNIKFEYNSNTYEIDVLLDRERIQKQEFSSFRRAIDGTGYTQYTSSSEKRVFVYQFGFCEKDVYDFFNDAREYHLSGGTVTMQRELDDSTFESFNIKINPVQYKDDTVSSDSTEKIYSNVFVEIIEL